MEIKLIGQALDEIKEEDQNNLNELKIKVDDMEKVYRSKRANTLELKSEYKLFENLNHIYDNPFEHLRMILPVLQIPLGVVLGILSWQFVFGGLLGFIVMFIAILMESDSLYTLLSKYPKVTENNKMGIKEYISTFKKLFMKRHDLRAKLVSAYNRYLDANNEEHDYSETLSVAKNQESELKRELLQLEGYISSIEYIIERRYLDSLADTSDIVTFINKKKELKKDC